MTYCVGLLLNEGMVLLSDTRTNAGLDNISTYRKMFTFEEPGERVIVIMTAGSLSVTQTTIAQLREAIDDREATPETSIMLAPTLLKVAEIVGARLAHVRAEVDEKLSAMQGASASMIRQLAQQDLVVQQDPEALSLLHYLRAHTDTQYLVW